jgi:hypothetical protein
MTSRARARHARSLRTCPIVKPAGVALLSKRAQFLGAYPLKDKSEITIPPRQNHAASTITVEINPAITREGAAGVAYCSSQVTPRGSLENLTRRACAPELPARGADVARPLNLAALSQRSAAGAGGRGPRFSAVRFLRVLVAKRSFQPSSARKARAAVATRYPPQRGCAGLLWYRLRGSPTTLIRTCSN